MAEIKSGKVKKTPPTQVPTDRYEFLHLADAEPDLGVPLGEGYVLTSGPTGARIWQSAASFQGPTGPTGPQGVQGTQGFTGPQGAQGANATNGTDGTQGPTGPQGAQGFTGAQGNQGNFGGITLNYLYSTNTSHTDPGSTYLKFDNTNFSLVTEMLMDDQDISATDVQSFLRTIDDSTSTIKGHFRISLKTDSTVFALFTISSIVEESGYFDVNCSYVSGSVTSFSNDANIIITFARTGDVGAQGAQGFTGPQGAQGAQGLQGIQGAQGAQGFTGPQGTQGFTGPQGVQGAQGFTGPQGTQGTQGSTGPQGVQGTQGFTGPQGLQGTQGFTGPQGTQGAQGTQGFTGPQGAQGAQGAQGFTGPQGAQGNQGTQGFTGPQGAQGAQGFTGPTGAQGTQGTQGFTGAQGTQGATGPQGTQGFTGPQGTQGFTGPQGAQGFTGPQGTQGFTGPQGTQGFTGPQGTQGFTGPQGTQGSTGSQGPQGFTGPQGTQGFTGPQGAQGTQGFTGPQGAQGPQGFTGPQGAPSTVTGPQGFTGPQGIQGNFGGITLDYTFDTNITQSDPGIGKLKFNALNIPTATQLWIDDQNDSSTDIQTFLRTIDDSTSTMKGHFRISNKADSTDFAIFTISAVTEQTGYFAVSCAYVSGSATAFSNGEDVIITFARTGDVGAQGSQGSQGAQGNQGAQGSQGAASTVAGPQGVPGAQGAQGAQGSQGTQGTSAVIGGSANQVVYKDGSNVATGSANLTFNGTTLTGVSAAFSSAAFSGSNGTALVSITQTGAGNSFIVQDSNPDSTPFVIDGIGWVGIGTSSPGSLLDVMGTITAHTTSVTDGIRLAGNGLNSSSRNITLTPASLSASHTLTLPNVTGTVVTTGDTGSVTNTMLAGSIADSKLSTISTAGKVSNSATTATNANTFSAIVARDTAGNFSAGTITASLAGNASTVTTNANLTGDVTSVGNATAIAAGVIVNADINASAGIVDTKLATISTAGKVSNSATTATSSNVANAIVARDGSNSFVAGTIDVTKIISYGTISGTDQIDAARLGTNITATSVGVLRVGNATSGTTCITTNGVTSTIYHMAFHQSGANVGGIVSSGSTTSFNTGSDYRLKENVLPLNDALATIELLQPKAYNFITTPETVHHGFLAHELAEVVPYAVTGEKDALDSEGNIRPQQVDYSKLTALLVGAVQELSARVRELENNQ